MPLSMTGSPRDKRDAAGLRCEWRRLARRLGDADLELDAETAVAVVTTYDRLRAAGAEVDTMAAALITQLRLQLVDAEAFLDG